jgi:uncharacterized protein with von Willebrand factor type A (vWA) domain
MRNILTITGALALTCALGTDARAQATGPQVMPPGAGGAQAEMQKKMAELEQLKTKLDGIRDEAMKDPALKKKRDALESKLDAAMKAEDPQALKKKAEYEELVEKLETAQASGDREKVTELAPRLQKLGQSLQATQQKVMKDEAVAEAVSEFQDAMIEQMKEVNPNTEKMLARAENIAKELQAAMGGMGGMGRPPGR